MLSQKICLLSLLNCCKNKEIFSKSHNFEYPIKAHIGDLSQILLIKTVLKSVLSPKYQMEKKAKKGHQKKSSKKRQKIKDKGFSFNKVQKM